MCVSNFKDADTMPTTEQLEARHLPRSGDGINANPLALLGRAVVHYSHSAQDPSAVRLLPEARAGGNVL